MIKHLADYNLDKLTEIVVSLGEKKFRAGQIYRAIMQGKEIDEITDLSKTFREKLKEEYDVTGMQIIKTLTSKDGTIKFLFKLFDGNVIEGVLMKYKYGNTQCVSTQVGCRMNCAFCASGLNGLVRNLTSGEILGQITLVNAYLGGTLDKRQVTNIVLMGSGEPLDNYDNTVNFLRTVSAEGGLNISTRNISLSTCGIVPNIYKLADEGFSLNLTISLHSPFDNERQRIMPVAKKYKINEVLNACKYYFEKTGRRYIFEYVLIQGENDGERHIEELTKLFKGKPCHLNLIRLNEVKEKNLSAVTDKNAYRFLGRLIDNGLSATLRRQIGVDIEGACGQLRQKYIENGENI